jgi:hypothetical protein
MRRRDLIVGAGAAAFAGGLLPGARMARAQLAFVPQAVHLDGASYYQNNGRIAGMPSQSPIGALVFKYRGSFGFVLGEKAVQGTTIVDSGLSGYKFAPRVAIEGSSPSYIGDNILSILGVTRAEFDTYYIVSAGGAVGSAGGYTFYPNHWYNGAPLFGNASDIYVYQVRYNVINMCGGYSRSVKVGIANGNMNIELRGTFDNNNCPGQNVVSGSVAMSTDNNWHDATLSWNGANGIIKGMIDGQTKTVTVSSTNGYDVATDYNSMCQIGGAVIGQAGDYADVGLFAGGPFIEPADIAGNLYSVESGYSLRNASNGYGIVSGRRPQIWLSGSIGSFPTNRAGGTQTWPATYNDTSPTSSFTAVGNPVTATSDPFEPGSPF